MTVKELIRVLRQYPGEMPVIVGMGPQDGQGRRDADGQWADRAGIWVVHEETLGSRYSALPGGDGIVLALLTRSATDD